MSRSTNTDVSDESTAEGSNPGGEEPDLWYAFVGPQCPICGSTDRIHSEEQVPGSYERHRVSTTCGQCGTHYSVEFRAVDIQWTTANNELQSGVAHGCIDPNEHPYTQQEGFSEMPDPETLRAFDWPLLCHCEERLTGNHIVSTDRDDADLDTTSDDGDEGTAVVLECPNCQDRIAMSPE